MGVACTGCCESDGSARLGFCSALAPSQGGGATRKKREAETAETFSTDHEFGSRQAAVEKCAMGNGRWVRLDYTYYTDGKLQKAGWEAVALWPVILARLGEGEGVREEDDFDQNLLARITGFPEKLVSKGLAGLTRVGLLAHGSIRKRGGAAGGREVSGIITPAWRSYHPGAGSVKVENRGDVSVSSSTVPFAGRERGTGTRDVTDDTNVTDVTKEPSVLGPDALRAIQDQAIKELVEFIIETWSDRTLGKPETFVKWVQTNALANPGVDLLAEAQAAAAWELSNPSKKKKQIRRFLGSWWSRAQDRGGSRPRTQPKEQPIEINPHSGLPAFKHPDPNIATPVSRHPDGVWCPNESEMKRHQPWREAFRGVIAEGMAKGNGDFDGYNDTQYIEALGKLNARPMARELRYAIDHFMTEYKEEAGL